MTVPEEQVVLVAQIASLQAGLLIASLQTIGWISLTALVDDAVNDASKRRP